MWASDHWAIAQVCLNGHLIASHLTAVPHELACCPRCGQPTICQCPECSALLKGNHYGGGATRSPMSRPEDFCEACGKPYPWTAKRLEAARLFTSELAEATEAEKEKLIESIDALVCDTPMKDVAIHRFQQFIARSRGPVVEAYKTILAPLITEAIKRQIFGNPGQR